MSRVQGKDLFRMFKKEAPSGTVDGSNDSFSLSHLPLEDDAVLIFLDGILTTDYSLTGTAITMTTPPALGQSLEAYYIQKTGE